jgi:hypothetical protein
MHRRTLIVLLLVVAVLGGLVWWQNRREGQSDAAVREHALLEGFDRTRVGAFHVDNLERSLQMRVEARPDGSWDIVDPVKYPAEPSVVDLLLDQLAEQRAKPVVGADPKKLSLEPPRVVLEIEMRGAAANAKRRIEIGLVDVDSQHVYARVDGAVVLTERGLDATLERDLPEWRARNILRIAGNSVVEVHRSGKILLPDATEPIDLALDAVLDGTWRATQPFAAQLDPSPLALLIANTATIEAQDFIDTPGGLEHYGLDHPRLRLELVDDHGQREVLLLTPESGSERWSAAREGSPYVYRVSLESVLALATPSDSLVDRKLVDVVRENITKVELELQDRVVTLTRQPRAWSLSASAGERVTIDNEVADPQRVEDLLSAIEHARLVGLLFDRHLAKEEIAGAIHVESSGDVQGGVLGPKFRSADGAEGVLFVRDGDGLVAVLDPALLDLAGTDPQSLRSLELHKVPELDVARIVLSYGGQQRTYLPNGTGQWVRQGTEIEARDFAKLVDRVLSIRALEVLRRGPDDQLATPVEVDIVTHRGQEIAFALGMFKASADAAPIAVYRSGSRMARVKPELADDLRVLLAAQ